jgi:hypothetical protein
MHGVAAHAAELADGRLAGPGRGSRRTGSRRRSIDPGRSSSEAVGATSLRRAAL